MTLEWGTASLLEIIWTAVALVGIGIAGLARHDASSDFSSLKKRGLAEGIRAITAQTNVRNETIRFVLLAIFAVVGTSAMAIPNDPDVYSFPRVMIAVGLLFGEALIVYATIKDRIARVKIINLAANVDVDSVKNTADSLARIEAASAVVAENLVTAQAEVDKVATDLAASHARADAVSGDPGEAADAASQSPKES